MTRPSSHTRSWLVLAACLAVPGTPLAGAGQIEDRPSASARADSVRADSLLEARTSEVARGLRCAVCQGISIQESPSALAQEMRAVVREQLRAGRTPEEVRAYFVSKYGEWILLSPKPRGLNLVLYVLPAAVLLGGGLLIFRAVRRWTAVPGAGAQGEVPATPARAPPPESGA